MQANAYVRIRADHLIVDIIILLKIIIIVRIEGRTRRTEEFLLPCCMAAGFSSARRETERQRQREVKRETAGITANRTHRECCLVCARWCWRTAHSMERTCSYRNPFWKPSRWKDHWSTSQVPLGRPVPDHSLSCAFRDTCEERCRRGRNVSSTDGTVLDLPENECRRLRAQDQLAR